MNAGRLKTVLIILFLAVNVFFVHKIVSITDAENTFTDEEVNEAIELVSQKGIKISAENVLRSKNPPKTLKLEWDVGIIDDAVKEIVHSEYGSFKIPNGHSFTSDTERFTMLYDYSFEYSRLTNTDTAETVAEALKNDDNGSSQKIKEYEKMLNKLTKRINNNNFRISAKIEKFVKIGSTEYILFSQHINNCKVENAEFVTVFRDGNLFFANGTFYFSDNVSEYTTNANDSINILFELEPSENEIIKAEKSYFPVRENDSSVYLTPSYKFTYDNGVSVLYDATSGTKRK